MAKKSFTFRDIYNPQMSPKRKSWEKLKNETNLKDIASTNTYYKELSDIQTKLTNDKKACQERQVSNQRQINELNESKALLQAGITSQQATVNASAATLASNNTTLLALQTAGITATNGGTMTLTAGASALLPVTIGLTTFTTTAQVQAFIDSTNIVLTNLIQEQNQLTETSDNYTKFKTQAEPYTNLLPYQLANYTGVNKVNFASVTGSSTTTSSLTQMDSYIASTAPLGGYQGQLLNINNKIASLSENCDETNAQTQRRIEELELATVISLIKDQEKVRGYKSKANPVAIALKYRALKDAGQNVNILEFVDKEFVSNSALFKAENKIKNLGRKVNSFTKAVEGKPGANKQIKEQLNQYGLFDPAVCGLLAMDNDGSILTTNKYHIPFQSVDVIGIKVTKKANYSDESPIGRYEPATVYGSSTAMNITIPLAYMAFESGYNSDEGYIQEIKDRFLAATFPIYGNYQRSGVRTYGAPHKYILNMFEKFVNIPVIIEDVTFEDQGGNDIYSWLSMGFKMNLILKTSYRIAQVISGDEVVDKGIRALSHKNNL